jgi:hypothetical protein
MHVQMQGQGASLQWQQQRATMAGVGAATEKYSWFSFSISIAGAARPGRQAKQLCHHLAQTLSPFQMLQRCRPCRAAEVAGSFST